MATAQSVINDARYDLTDYVDGTGVGIAYDDTELLAYLNRMIGLMDSTLSALQSDIVEEEELGIDTVASQNYVDISALNSGLWTRIRSVWLGSSMLEQVSLSYMRYTRRYRSGEAEPTIWALSGQKILFPQDDNKSRTDLIIYYDKKSAKLGLTEAMPFFDIFNEFIREMLVMTAKAKAMGAVEKSDQLFQSLFRTRAMHEEIARGFVPKPYVYWEF